jgi:hypothetical protein
LVAEAQTLGAAKFLLKYSGIYGRIASFAATQAELGPYAQIKLPSFYKNNCFYTRRSLEQCTSEAVALYKSSLFRSRNLLVLAAGLGVDDWAFSFSFEHIVSVDPDEDLNAIAESNAIKLQRENIKRITSSAEAYLTGNTTQFDFIYTDPDRRVDDKRQILLSQHQPNIIQLIPELKKISRNLLVKCSPMYDHEMAAREIENLRELYIVSYRGEVKEMLLHADFEYEGPYQIHCVEVGSSGQVSFSQNDTGLPASATLLEGFFYEVSAGISKVRKHHHYASMLGLHLIDPSVPFYCSPILVNDFQGRCFNIIHAMPFKSAACSAYLKENRIQKANVKARGLQFNTVEVYKKLKLGEGGDDYLFIFPFKGEPHIAHCKY